MLPLLHRGRGGDGHRLPAAVLPALDSLLATRHATAPRAASSRSTTGRGTGSTRTGRSCPGSASDPPGAELYPHDMTKEEFEPGRRGLARGGERPPRDLHRSAPGQRRGPRGRAVPPGRTPRRCGRAAAKLREAAALADDAGLRQLSRAPRPGPGDRRVSAERPRLARHEDQHGSTWSSARSRPTSTSSSAHKAAAEAYVLLKDKEWSGRLPRYVALLPALQRGLPVPEAYKRERPGHRLRPQRVRRALLRRRRQRRLEDHRHQPAQRRGSAAPEGHPPAPAQERDAGQVRPDPGADRGRADRGGPAAAHQVRRLLRQRHVPRGGARPGHQAHRSTARAPCGRRSRSRPARSRRARPTSSASTWSPGCWSRAS